jgi:nitroimidazol reductase NimA-like FMN-containing flavoprotein (pyridoxamine 5'-phosphate oxidase superfamily)
MGSPAPTTPVPLSSRPDPLEARVVRRDDILELLRRLPTVCVAGSAADGTPLLGTVHHAIVGDWLVFHGAPRGWRAALVDRPVVVEASEPVAVLPSTLVDPERACHASTWYRQARVRGQLTRVEEPEFVAATLERLMRKLQPDEAWRPITATEPMYRRALERTGVFRVALDRLEGKEKLGQGKSEATIQRVVEWLRTRGNPGDMEAVDQILGARSGTEQGG